MKEAVSWIIYSKTQESIGDLFIDSKQKVTSNFSSKFSVSYFSSHKILIVSNLKWLCVAKIKTYANLIKLGQLLKFFPCVLAEIATCCGQFLFYLISFH